MSDACVTLGHGPSLRRFRIYVKDGTEIIPSKLVAEVLFPKNAGDDTVGTIRWHTDPCPEWLIQLLDPPTYARISDLIGRSNGITWLCVGYRD